MSISRLAAAAALACAALGAHATTVTLSNITGLWQNANPAANITSNTGAGTNTSVRWGASGYDFAGATPSVSATLPPNPSADFVIGGFQHVNQPIPAGTSITDIQLKLTASVAVDAVNVGVLTFVYQFTHNETNNGDAICADGNPNGVGVNVNGCADSVTVGYLDASESFDIGGELYTVNISGFEVGGNKVNTFWTAEQATNPANLLGNVVRRRDVTVPEPGTMALSGLALLAAAGLRRRKA